VSTAAPSMVSVFLHHRRKWQHTQQIREEEHKKQLDHARKLAESDAERFQRRTEADMADLKATISRLEVDLMKVWVRKFMCKVAA